MVPGSSHSLGKTTINKSRHSIAGTSVTCMKSLAVTYPGNMALLKCEIYQHGRVSGVAETELILLIAHLIRPSGSIPDVG